MSVTAVTQSIGGTGQAASATGKLADDFQTFLTLLVAQIQNQAPLAPMESTEFVSQLAQLTQVEQSVQVNTQMAALREQLALNAALSETALIGREVTVAAEHVTLGDSDTEFFYRLDTPVTTVQAQIYDESGKLVRVLDGLPVNADGLHRVTWDGLADDGTMAAKGRYKIAIAAAGVDGEKGAYNSYSSSVVEAIDYEGGRTWLQLADGSRVQSGDIIRAR